MDTIKKIALIFGGAGQLGSVVVTKFSENGWNTISADFRASENATQSIMLSVSSSTKENTETCIKHLEGKELDLLVCVAGGWTGGNVANSDIFDGVEKMWNFNVQSAIASSHLASKFLKKKTGVLVLTGATAALDATPGMIAYGITKAATHHLIKSLVEPAGGLPEGSTVIGMLPVTLDTPSNREGMPDAKWDDWTPLEEVANILLKWTSKECPPSGSLIKLITKDGKTELVSV